jgi:hypothetical protein
VTSLLRCVKGQPTTAGVTATGMAAAESGRSKDTTGEGLSVLEAGGLRPNVLSNQSLVRNSFQNTIANHSGFRGYQISAAAGFILISRKEILILEYIFPNFDRGGECLIV